jgi:hypothetical protein
MLVIESMGLGGLVCFVIICRGISGSTKRRLSSCLSCGSNYKHGVDEVDERPKSRDELALCSVQREDHNETPSHYTYSKELSNHQEES